MLSYEPIIPNKFISIEAHEKILEDQLHQYKVILRQCYNFCGRTDSDGDALNPTLARNIKQLLGK